MNSQFEGKTFEGFHLLACDGTGLAFNSDWDFDYFVRGPNKYYGVHINFCMEITNHAEAVMRIKKQQKKWWYVYRLNISEALKTCHDFLLMDKRVQHHTDIIGWILKAGYCPVRAGRNYEKKKFPHGAKSFNCR